jgi:DNA repair ATPase RecN
MTAVFDLAQKVSRLEGERHGLIKERAECESALDANAIKMATLELAQALIQQTAQETQERLKFHIQELVSGAINAVFPGAYEFRCDFLVKRGSTEGDIYLLKDGERIDPMDSTGGGVVDIVAFALRLVAWSIGKSDNVIILDEPFKFLSVGLRPLAGELLRTLSGRLGIQLIYVTHDPELVGVADRIFEVSQSDGISKVIQREGTPE